MKNIIFVFGMACFLLWACNSNDSKGTNTPPVPAANDTVAKLQAAIVQYPDSLLLKETLIQYYREKGDYGMAISEANKVLEKDSFNTRFWDIKAVLHQENGDTLASIKSYEILVSIQPSPENVMMLASLYAETKDPQALVLADALIQGKAAKAEKEANFIKGLYYTYSGNKVKAIEFFDKCLALDYTYMFAYREKAIALFDMGKYEDALNVASKAVTLQNNFDEGYYWMGRCLEKLNRKDEAVESYRTALKYDPNYVEAKEALGKLGAN